MYSLKNIYATYVTEDRKSILNDCHKCEKIVVAAHRYHKHCGGVNGGSNIYLHSMLNTERRITGCWHTVYVCYCCEWLDSNEYKY